MISARNLAHHIVHKCTIDQKPVSNLQLQKILYFLQSVYCRATGGNLLFDESFQAWPYGPVLSEIYREYSQFGGRVIEMTYDDGTELLAVSPELQRFIDDGIENLRLRYPWDLVQSSHAKGSPWDQVYKGGEGYKHQIPNELIRLAATQN